MVSQKAPSAKRCIKTARNGTRPPRRVSVRKHRAPKGALRLDNRIIRHDSEDKVRKHRAPKGALRPTKLSYTPFLLLFRQKAPSAKRCIKTSE